MKLLLRKVFVFILSVTHSMLSQLLKPWQQLSKICLLLQKFPKQTVLEERFISESTQMRVVCSRLVVVGPGEAKKRQGKREKKQRGD